MSFVDDIFSTISNSVQHLFGMSPPDAGTPQHADSDATPQVASNPSTAAPTEWAAAESAPTSSQRPSMLEAVMEFRNSRAETPTPTPTPTPTSILRTPTIAHETPAPVLTPSPSPAPTPRARVYDASTNASLGTADTLEGTSDAAAAAQNVQAGIDWLAETFGRNGVDDAGSGVDVMVDDTSIDPATGKQRFQGNGGYFRMPDATGTQREAIHFGEGISYTRNGETVDQAPMQHADDLTIHELMHGVIRSETGQIGGNPTESGATNEALADVLAASATRDWKIGEGMYDDSSDYAIMRNIADPDDPTAIHGLWTTMDEVRDNTKSGEPAEEHWASGVISTAAQRTQARIGGEAGWQFVEHVFYDAINDHRVGDMSFQRVANGLRAAASARYGSSSPMTMALDEELKRAGV